jgi:hypothetical protein
VSRGFIKLTATTAVGVASLGTAGTASATEPPRITPLRIPTAAGTFDIAAAKYARRVRSLTAVSVPHLGAFSEALRTDPAQQEAST